MYEEYRPREPKEWTVMFFFASDNPLAPSTVSQLKQIKNAGYQHDVNVLAHFDPHSPNTPPHIYDVNLIHKIKDRDDNIGFAGNDPFVRNLVMDKLWPEGEIRKKIQVEMAKRGYDNYDPPKPLAVMAHEQNPKQSLDNFLTFCRVNYPARHYLLFLMGHGMIVGNDLFLLDNNGSPTDFSSPQNSLLLTDLGKVIKKFKARIANEGELELIGFHCCSMSGLEVAYELRDTAKYMLASQGPAFVGSWPYRQILVKLFNSVKSSGSGQAQSVGPQGRDADRREPNGAKAAVEVAGVGAIRGVTPAPRVDVDLPDRREPKPSIKPVSTPKQMSDAEIKDMLINFFYYCLYNSYDFQLAGYSFDLCLSNLRKVGEIAEPLNNLSLRLIEALRNNGEGSDRNRNGYRQEDLPARDPIIVTHWEAQSFFSENYTDLYDFCFRLNQPRKSESDVTKRVMQPVRDATYAVMKGLQRGVRGNDDGIIVRSESAGPASQYAHGLSIFFPWSEPIGNRMWDLHYDLFELIERTGWRDFLIEYFAATKRKTHSEENDPLEFEAPTDLTEELLQLFEEFTSQIFNEVGQLKGGAGDAIGPESGKGGAGDPIGADGGCSVIKNYPRFTRPFGERERNGKPMASTNFFRKQRSEIEFDK